MASFNGTSGNDNLVGTLGSDSFFGDLGDDILDGRGGGDTFVFNDVFGTLYFPIAKPDDTQDVHVYSNDGLDIIKNFSIGKDSIISIDPKTHSRKHVDMPYDVSSPNLKMRNETESIFGTIYSDTINGTSAHETIYGLSGNDLLYGNAGNDVLYGDAGDDRLYGGAGSNVLYGGPGNDYLSGGGDANNELYGDAGDDILDGSGSYPDILIGGTGNDTYIVGNLVIIKEYNLGDQITEKLNEGTDTVKSPISHKLGDNLENLVLTGSEDINGLGNALDNRIEGNAGQNFLAGGDGNDYLLGYGGDDILVGEAGNDTLEGGAGDDLLDGGAGNDTLIGGTGNDRLNGGVGSDTLTGGAGVDKFVFNSTSQGIDIIKDFSSVESDKIQISKTGFGATSTNQFSYNNNTGALSFQGTHFATLENKPSFVPSVDIELVSSSGVTSSQPGTFIGVAN
ncbi:calcium-binding protein [Iningainema tapete]|uniref:Calcium-binding protein n=1 Tax=Iningainema tapete BLCC-T55 TaxID=2748662 RepID=A0A8J6XID1_9CYAN|nr:hypothetical protein [Iningainema tapete BLCC-T55]